MRRRPSAAIAAILVVVATAGLSGCVGAPLRLISGSEVSVGAAQPFFSLNSATSFGDAPGNAAIGWATGSGFTVLDETGTPVPDPSFGSYEKLSDDPLVVKYTVADGVQWSDGSPVDAADLLLAWAAESGALNDSDFDPSPFVDAATGAFTDQYPADVVYFDSGADRGNLGGVGLAPSIPEVSADRVSITLRYDTPAVDWETAFLPLSSPPLPAHVVASHALGIEDPQAAKDAVITAVLDEDRSALARLSGFWNTGFNFEQMPADDDVLVASGPYVVSDFVAGQYVTLEANPRYSGARQPAIETVTVRFIADPLAASQALLMGEVDVISPQATEEVVDALGTLGVTVVSGFENTFEHVDLRFAESKSGVFGDPLVREAFLRAIPRAAIVEQLVAPVQEDATTRDSYLFLPGTPGYQDAVQQNDSESFATADVAAAQALLQQAGLTRPPVCILFDPEDPRAVAEFALIAASAGAAGFSVEDCSNADWSTVLGLPGGYDAVILGSEAAPSGDPDVYATDGPGNDSGYSNPQVDELLADLATERDPDARRGVLTQIDALLWADHYGVPLYQYPAVTAFDQDTVRGIRPVAFAPGVMWNVWDWTPAGATG